MKSFAAFIVIFVIGVDCQTNPLAWSREQRSRQNVHETSNDVIVNTDRLMSSIESRVLTIIRSELNVLKQQLDRVEQSNSRLQRDLTLLKSEVAHLPTVLGSVRDETSQEQGLGPKLDNMNILISAVRGTVNKVEREILIVKKNTRAINSSGHNQHHFSLISSRDDDIQSHGVCSVTDPTTGSGVFQIRKNFFTSCQMDSEEGGGWIVIQNRFDGAVDFFRNFDDYKNGFGNIAGEFWMGLEKIHELTSSRLYELMILMENFDETKKSAKYAAFAISDESSSYALSLLGKFSGDAGDSLTYHAGMKFSTYDNDNDSWADGNCARAHFGGWWYNSCDESNLNGRYFQNGVLLASNNYQGVYWGSFVDSFNSMKSVKMMIRPVDV